MENKSWQERFAKMFSGHSEGIIKEFIQSEITRAEKEIADFILSEEIEMQVGDNINELLEYRGISDSGKSMRGGVKEKILEPLVNRINRKLIIESK